MRTYIARFTVETTAQSKLSPAFLEPLIRELGFSEPVMVTRPSMPALADYTGLLEGIWQRRWLTNDGQFHRELEAKLSAYLGVEHLSLFCNGATALLVMLQALGIGDGEVITTPFTFPATTHVLHWNGVRPVFCDVEESTFNLDPRRLDELVGPETRAILAVHVYGNPCDVEALEALGRRHGLPVIYDAAHAFGVRLNGRSILDYGAMSMLSFHATKVFSTIEGGALSCASESMRVRINALKNFGIIDEETIIGPGINGKMNEFQAAFGLLQLRTVDEEIARRRDLALSYRKHLAGIEGLQFLEDRPGVRHNHGYFPVRVAADAFGMSRDDLHRFFKQFNVTARKYFYPLVSHAPCYADLPSAAPARLPVAERVSREVLCLPIYGSLDASAPQMISRIIRALQAAS